MTSLAQRSWDAFSAEDREERRALGGLTLKMYDEAEVPLDHALRHWSYREFPRDLGHISKIYNGEVIGSYLEAGGNPSSMAQNLWRPSYQPTTGGRPLLIYDASKKPNLCCAK